MFIGLSTGPLQHTRFGSRYLPHTMLLLTVLQLLTLATGGIGGMQFTTHQAIALTPTEVVGAVGATTRAGLAVYLVGASVGLGLGGTVPAMVVLARRHSTYVALVEGY